jgi:MarR family transcriptional regulator, temperature-dependent positive regulator of motility
LLRETMGSNRRMLCLSLTPEGEKTLANMVPGVHRMREALLGALEPSERVTFMRLLRKFVHVNNEQSPAPLHREAQASPSPTRKPAAPRKVVAKKAR